MSPSCLTSLVSHLLSVLRLLYVSCLTSIVRLLSVSSLHPVSHCFKWLKFFFTGKFTSICRIFSSYRLDYIIRSIDVLFYVYLPDLICSVYMYYFPVHICMHRKNPVKLTKIPKKFGSKPKYRKNSALNQNTEKSGKTENFTDFLICFFYFQYYIYDGVV